ASSGSKLHQHLAEPGIARRAAHQADVWRAIEDLLAFLLRHAAEDAEYFAFARFTLERLQAAEHLLLRLVANAAGVVEHERGRLGRLHLRISFGLQSSHDLLGIVGVHLAAEGFYVESFPRHVALL